MTNYIPKKGDIIEMDFNPIKGHEQSGKRPALIISNESYYKKTKLLIVCPISNTKNDFPMHIKLDDRTTTTGSILSQHIRTVDPAARQISFIEVMPSELTEQAIKNIGLCFI
jgi:mRNA interferase MazF